MSLVGLNCGIYLYVTESVSAFMFSLFMFSVFLSIYAHNSLFLLYVVPVSNLSKMNETVTMVTFMCTVCE